jgi:hypothetical protein
MRGARATVRDGAPVVGARRERDEPATMPQLALEPVDECPGAADRHEAQPPRSRR